MSLREARQAANDALLLIQRGEKPFILPAPKNVFSKVGQEFLEDKKRRGQARLLPHTRQQETTNRVFRSLSEGSPETSAAAT